MVVCDVKLHIDNYLSTKATVAYESNNRSVHAGAK